MAQIDDIINPADIKSIKDLADSFNKLNEEFKKIKSETTEQPFKKGADGANEYAKMVNKAVNVNNKLTMTAKELENQNKQLVTTSIKLSQVEGSKNIELQKQKIALQEANKALRDKIKAENENAGSINRLKTMWSDFTTKLKAGEMGFKSSAQAVSALGKQLFLVFISNPLLLAIGAIVGAIAGLVAIFKSTDSGATALEGAFKGLKNIVDILVDRLGALIKLDFKSAFGGMGKQVKEAAKAGWDYAQSMDSIKDREAASLNRREKLKKQYEELYTLSKDESLSRQEQIKYADEALKIAEELNSIEIGFLKERNQAELNNLASKLNNSKLSQEEKRKELETWLAVDDKELFALMEKDAAFKEFYDKNEDAFQALQKTKADEVAKEGELIKETRRLQTALFSDRKKLDDEARASAKKAAEEREKIEEARAAATTKAFEREYEMQLLLIKASGLSKEEQEAKTFELKKQYLQKTLDLLQIELNAVKGNELEKIKIQERINDERAKLDGLVIEKRISDNEIAGTKMMSSEEMMNKRKADQESKYGTDLVATTQAVADQKQIIAESELNDLILKQEEKNEIIRAGQEAAIQIQGSLLNFFIEGYQDDLEQLEQKNAAGLLSDKEYARQKAEIEIKQAKAKKLQGAFETTINTAAAIVGMLKDPGGVAGTIMAVAAGITGGLQLASILSAPLPTIPAFAEGTTNAPALGLAGEAGTELGITKTGEAILFDKPTVFKGSKFKGMHIYSNPEFEAMKAMNNFNYVSDNTAIVSKLESLEKTIKDKPVFIFDKDKNVVGMMKSNHIERYINRYK
jgi:hypothetical protein